MTKQPLMNSCVLRSAKRIKLSNSDSSLSHAFENCLGRYLFLQCFLQDSVIYSVLYPQFVDYIFGDDADEVFAVQYYTLL
jgi:hypothetical protein